MPNLLPTYRLKRENIFSGPLLVQRAANVFKKVPQIVCVYPIMFRNIVIMPVLITSTNIAPIIGTIKNGFVE